MLRPRTVLLVGFGALLTIFLLGSLNSYFYDSWCSYAPSEGYSINYCNVAAATLFPVVATIPFALALIFVREEIFRSWFRFVAWSTPLSMLLIAISPNHGGGYIYPTQQAIFTVLLPLIFSIVSLFIIGLKWYKLRGK